MRQGRPSLSCHIAGANCGRTRISRSGAAGFFGLCGASVFEIAKQPSFCGDRIVVEVTGATARRSTLDLKTCKRLGHDKRDTLRLAFRLGQHGGESLDDILRLNLHVSNIDESKMLVGTAAKLPVGIVARLNKPIHVIWIEEARQANSYQASACVDFN